MTQPGHDVVYLCRDDLTPLRLDVVSRLRDGSPGEWRWVCPSCGAEAGFGYRSEEGTLDLATGEIHYP